ncbi:hypothetical protein BDV96DRAFT_595649 [Lophiotrema nucula]|uniref:Uncharacterized protein n=1 Tax=Lophiotrema nucula TaxID=690887 RepID=A0A6A5ZL93_9PLEO|nr:hypothetical protein BDV96DRAFT_595649 [Lophiotrema nucula]
MDTLQDNVKGLAISDDRDAFSSSELSLPPPGLLSESLGPESGYDDVGGSEQDGGLETTRRRKGTLHHNRKTFMGGSSSEQTWGFIRFYAHRNCSTVFTVVPLDGSPYKEARVKDSFDDINLMFLFCAINWSEGKYNRRREMGIVIQWMFLTAGKIDSLGNKIDERIVKNRLRKGASLVASVNRTIEELGMEPSIYRPGEHLLNDEPVQIEGLYLANSVKDRSPQDQDMDFDLETTAIMDSPKPSILINVHRKSVHTCASSIHRAISAAPRPSLPLIGPALPDEFVSRETINGKFISSDVQQRTALPEWAEVPTQNEAPHAMLRPAKQSNPRGLSEAFENILCLQQECDGRTSATLSPRPTPVPPSGTMASEAIDSPDLGGSALNSRHHHVPRPGAHVPCTSVPAWSQGHPTPRKDVQFAGSVQRPAIPPSPLLQRSLPAYPGSPFSHRPHPLNSMLLSIEQYTNASTSSVPFMSRVDALLEERKALRESLQAQRCSRHEQIIKRSGDSREVLVG